MAITIALAGNPNSGKTTLFNGLTGSNQYVGNWPGVTVEKKEGKLKWNNEIKIMDLPGIYSLSPYSLEEVVTREYLTNEKPDVILNIVDGTNLERNLFLTTQLVELGIPVVVAVNMMDVVEKQGDHINTQQLAKELGCHVVSISALKGTGIREAADVAIKAAKNAKMVPRHSFSGSVEHALAHIEEAVLHDMPASQQRWYAIKLFERDKKIMEKLSLSADVAAHIEQDIVQCEQEMEDDSESIITSERYGYIDSIIDDCCKIKHRGKLSISDRIDRVVTNRILALPIFALVMFIVYFVSISTFGVGTPATDWVNDGVFGDGWHLLGIGSSKFEEASEEFEFAMAKQEAFIEVAQEAGVETEAVEQELEAGLMDGAAINEFLALPQVQELHTEAEILDDMGKVTEVLPVDLAGFNSTLGMEEPEPENFGVWVPGLPVLLGSGMEAIGVAQWLQELVLDGIVAGVGAVLGFLPQMLVLFIFLAFLEECGYMARVAFILDRIFRKFGLSGKSFIPILIGTGCGVPGIMASRTIENSRDRRMTIITTTFIPCSAKLPIIALIAGALFGGAWWVAPSAYFVGLAAIICSGIILKKTRPFEGEAAPFVMELPAYHWPRVGSVLRSMWERGSSFVKKAGTIILLATVFIWFTSRFGWENGSFGMVEMDNSMLAVAGNSIAWIFSPLGWGNWRAAVATITGLIAKENVVGTFGVLYGNSEVSDFGREIWSDLAATFTPLAAYSFLVFNLLCAPCFAAIGAIRREMNSAKWFWFSIAYQCGLAYIASFCLYQIGMLVSAGLFGVGTVIAILFVIGFLWLLFRKPSWKPGGLGKKSKEVNV